MSANHYRERPANRSGPFELVTEVVNRHVVVTCFRVLSELPTSCNPRFWPKNAV